MATSCHLLLFLLISSVSLLTSTAYHPSLMPHVNHQHADKIIQAMIGTGEFRDWASDFLSAVDDQFGIPLSATIFIPSDFDISSSNGGSHLSIGYHIVTQRLSFTDLRLLKPLSRLPTLLRGNSIVVTNNSIPDYTIDGVLVTKPDLFLSSSIAIHGIASTLDFSRYGAGDSDTTLADSLRPLRRHPIPPLGPHDSPESNINHTTPVSISVLSFSTCTFLFPIALLLF